MRRAFIAFAWAPSNAPAALRADALAQRVQSETGWQGEVVFPGFSLWMPPGAAAHPLIRAPHGRGLLLGDAIPLPAQETAQSPATILLDAPDPETAMVRLSRTYWGRYLAFTPAEQEGRLGIYRDPSGALECMTWDLGEGLHALASDMVRAPRWMRPRRQSLNWDRLGELLTVPYAAMSTPLFDDIAVVAPGEMLMIGGHAPRATNIWSPGMFAAPSTGSLPDLQMELVRRLDCCTASLAQRYDKLIVELSGGLDSSVLAAALAATGETRRVAAWLNYRGERLEGDESGFARDVTDRIGQKLRSVRKQAVPLDETVLAELAQEFWPAMAGVDAGRDRHELGLLRETGAQAIFSGQGGDGVYFQYPTAMVAADEVHRRGAAALCSPVLANVARRTRQSVWSVLREVRRARHGAEVRPNVSSRILAAEWRDQARTITHPWVRDARGRGLPPGKVLHAQGVAVTHLYNGRSRRRREADLVYPHFAQPVVELCMSIATPDLAGGSYDRPFAREAFAERLPPSIVARRSKGNLTAWFTHLVVQSADALRPFLLDGCLCEAGLLDRAAVEAQLDPERLIWQGSPTDLLWAAVTEAWVRYWQTQVPDATGAARRLPAA